MWSTNRAKQSCLGKADKEKLDGYIKGLRGNVGAMEEARDSFSLEKKKHLNNYIAPEVDSHHDFVASNGQVFPRFTYSKNGLNQQIPEHNLRIEALEKIKLSEPISQQMKELLLQMPVFANDPLVRDYNNIAPPANRPN